MTIPVDLHLSCAGLGDAVCGLYAACGLAEAGYPVRYHHRYLPWLSRCTHPGVAVSPQRPGPNTPAPGIDMNWDYPAQLVSGRDRKQWYCDAVARALGITPFAPARPRFMDRRGLRRRRTRYVLFSPYSAHATRCWPLHHWLRLAELISRSRLAVWMTCTPDRRADIARVFGPQVHFPGWLKLFSRLTPEALVELVLNAECVVGNDSGIPHLAGLFGVPTVAIHAHLSAELLWSHTQVRGLTPDTRCSPCSWRHARGFTHSCELQCTALSGISPERVLDTMGDLLNRP